MSMLTRLVTAVATLMLVVSLLRADEAPTRAAAKAALAKYRDAIVTVKLTLKTRTVIGGKELGKSESQMEIIGTVLAPTGLTLVSDFSSNPGGLFSGLMGEDESKVETTDVKLLLKGGREIPAKFVLRDKDLDLAFIQPQEKGLDLPHVKLATGPVPEPLDDLVFVYRMGKAMNREAGVALSHVEAVVKKPRVFVVPELLTGLQSLGCPAFDATGRPIGVVVIRRSPVALKNLGGVRDILEIIKPVVLTTEDIEQAAGQVARPKDDAK
jgi:hypothetical protein